MNTAAILRALADMIDRHSAGHGPEDNKPVLSPPEQEPTPEPTFDKMVPPLQQKMELLKKVAGVPSEFDGKEKDDEHSCGCEDPDEIDIMKKNAGIIAHVAGEDNNITG